jgi:hypothetical protein
MTSVAINKKILTKTFESFSQKKPAGFNDADTESSHMLNAFCTLGFACVS